MPRVLGWLVSTIFWTGFFLLGSYVLRRIPRIDDLEPLLFGGTMAFWLFGLIYPRIRAGQSWHHSKFRLLIISAMFVILLAGAYSYSLITRSVKLYNILTEEQPLFKGERLRKSDLSYGYRHLPNVHALDLKMPGDTVHVYTDGDGFRVAASDTARLNRPGGIDVLFLGCSFTYGEMCEADSIFVNRTASSANLHCINVGVSGWGLSQMRLAASELIPKYKPKHVVFQYSYWLPQRGISRYKSSMGLPLPNPHFIKGDQRFSMRLPGYASELFDCDRNIIQPAYAEAPVRFFFEQGLGIFLREDKNRLRNRFDMWKQGDALVSQDEKTTTLLCRQVYQEMMSLAVAHKAVPHLLYLAEWSGKPMPMDSVFLSGFPDSIVMNAVNDHEKFLRENTGLSRKWAFVHWRMQDGDSIKVDGHPNVLSHRLITRSILDGLGYRHIEVR